MNSRQMRQMMKQMGIQQQEIPASQVIIIQEDKRIVIDDPQVSRVNMMGQDTWQVVGASREETIDSTPDISEEDVRTVMEQTGSSEEDARRAIEGAKGDLAEAILSFQEE